jgi:hypothetical protein
MSPSARGPKLWFAKCLCTLSAATMLAGCKPLIRPSPHRDLIQVACPQLTPLTDDSFGATTLKLVEVAGLYYRCRAAALAE